MQNSNQSNQDVKKADNQNKLDQQNELKRTGQDQQRMGKTDPNKEGGDIEEGSEREDLHAGKNMGERGGSQGNTMSGQPNVTNKQGMGNQQEDKSQATGNTSSRQPNQGNANDRANMRQDQDVDTDGKSEQDTNRKNQ